MEAYFVPRGDKTRKAHNNTANSHQQRPRSHTSRRAQTQNQERP